MSDFQQAYPESPNDRAGIDRAVPGRKLQAEDADRHASLQVTVRLFAAAAELMAARQVPLQVGVGRPVTLRQLRMDFVSQYPRLTMLESISRWAVDSDFIDDDWELTSDVTIAMIPPVSGG